MIAHEYVEPPFKVMNCFAGQVGEYFHEYLLHGVFGMGFIFQVFERYAKQQRCIALQQVPQPLVVAGVPVCQQQFFIGLVSMLGFAGQVLFSLQLAVYSSTLQFTVLDWQYCLYEDP